MSGEVIGSPDLHNPPSSDEGTSGNSDISDTTKLTTYVLSWFIANILSYHQSEN